MVDENSIVKIEKSKIKEIEVQKPKGQGTGIVKFSVPNCENWGIKRPKDGQKIKIIYDWG